MCGIFWALLLLMCAEGITEDPSKKIESLKYCSFFNNRAPKPQSNLFNCTWFKANSCCVQEEIDETFSQVKTLPGASPACQKYTNYLMCYICAPHQNTFYSQGILTVCQEFCDAWYQACGSAILKGSRVNDLYKSGLQFCKSRSFNVTPIANSQCFFFDALLDKTNGEIGVLHKAASYFSWTAIMVLVLIQLVLPV